MPFQHHMRWQPEVVHGPVPSHAIRHPAPVSVLFMQMHGHNFGHVLFDELLPVFTLLDLFGLAEMADVLAIDYQNFAVQYPHHVTKEQVCGDGGLLGACSLLVCSAREFHVYPPRQYLCKVQVCTVVSPCISLYISLQVRTDVGS